MEDKKKKSIVYLLQGLAGNIRNKRNGSSKVTCT